jgi:ATP-dependent DNA helicase RecG
VSRRYRNRRIGEFFKEIDLAEKKSTGIRKILRTLEKNGSPKPTFKTDKGRHSLETTIWIHEGFKTEDVSNYERNVGDNNLTESFTENLTENLTEKELEVVSLLIENCELTSVEMAARIGVSRQTIASRLKSLKEKNIIRREGSDTKGHWEIIRD